VGDGEADGDSALVAEADAAVGGATLAVGAATAVAAALEEAAASAAFLADTAVMLEKSKETARARPTINVITGVGIFMSRGTQAGPRRFNAFTELE